MAEEVIVSQSASGLCRENVLCAEQMGERF